MDSRRCEANQPIEGSAEQRRCSVPSALRSSAPPHWQRSAFRACGENCQGSWRLNRPWSRSE